MTNLELVLNMLAETSTTEISKKKKPNTFSKNKVIAQQGGEIAGEARKKLEKRIRESVLTSKNAKQLHSSNKK